MTRPRSMGTAVVGLAAALAIGTAGLAGAATRYVDGGCPTSGNGTSLTCGASGPWKTIMEGVKAMVPGDTLNIRGAHGSFDGRYDEYVGLWGDGSVAAPGGGAYRSLNCTAAAPCVIQGCPASACGTDETPAISGLTRRTDWIDAGGGVWYRPMEVRDPTTATEWAMQNEIASGYGPADTSDPVAILYGTYPTLDWLRYDPADNTPPDGFWRYDPATRRAYINPPGTANPNTGGIDVYVPNHHSMVVVNGREDNPGPLVANNNTTFRRLVIEGGRWVGMEIFNGIGNGAGTRFENVTVRYTNRMGIVGANFQNLSVSNLLVEKMARGTSMWINQSCFGLRLFDVHTGTIADSTFRNLGTNLGGKDYYWAEPPWDQRPAGADPTAAHTGCRAVGLNVKQSFNVTVERILVSRTSGDGFEFDAVEGGVAQDSTFEHAYSCVKINDGNNSCNAVIGRPCHLDGITFRRNRVDDCGYDTNSGGIHIQNQNNNVDNIEIYDNVISRSSCAAIITMTSTDPISNLHVYNNTIWRKRGLYSGYANDWTTGIDVEGPHPGLKIKNNVLVDFDTDFIALNAGAVASSGFELDYNLYRKNGSVTLSGGLVNWGGTRYTTLAALRAARPTLEVAGLEGDPRFANATALDFRLCEGAGAPVAACTGRSPAIDSGVNVGLPFSGPAPDRGYAEVAGAAPIAAPTLLDVAPVP